MGLEKFGPEHVFKPYLKPLSGAPEIGFRSGLNKFDDPNFPKSYPKPYLEKPGRVPGQTYRGLKYIIYVFYIFAVGPKNAKCPRMGRIIGLRRCFLVQPELLFEPGPFPELPGPAVGPKGPKIDQKPGAGFII